MVSIHLGLFTHAQVFDIPQPKTKLIKKTNQSPAHWYVEIENLTNDEQNLRWKFSRGRTCPEAWEFNFDVQTASYPLVLDKDSADFTLRKQEGLPQKLIIGNTLNNTPGEGTAYFDIYDPSQRDYVVTVEYAFVVTELNTAISNQVSKTELFTFRAGSLVFDPSLFGGQVVVLNTLGQVLVSQTISDKKMTLPTDELLIVQIAKGRLREIEKVRVE